jgi:hypothetical protein
MRTRIMYRNRLKDRIPPELPSISPSGPFSDKEAYELLQSYKKDPASLTCPLCGPEKMIILAFISPNIASDGFAEVKQPDGTYAVAVYCTSCRRAIGLMAGAEQDL